MSITELLSRTVEDKLGVGRTRARLQAMLDELQVGQSYAALCSAEFSNVLRSAIDVAGPCEVTLEWRDGGALSALLQAEKDLSTVRDAQSGWTGRWHSGPEGDATVLRCTFDLPSHTNPKPPVATLVEIAQGQTREELLAVLRAQNLALEETVDRRTSEIQGALGRAKEASSAKSDFLSHMSHELRTPLHGVLGYVQILLGTDDSTPAQEEPLRAIKKCGEHLLELINTVLDLSRFESGQMEPVWGACRVRDVARDTTNIIRAAAEKRGIEVRMLVASDVPHDIWTDETRLKQVLVNLMGNASKFTEEGVIALEVKRVESSLQFTVVDTGPGMSEEEVSNVMLPFQQGSAGERSGGTGLGMAISHAIATVLGGSLAIESALGEGTCATLTIPAREPSQDEHHNTAVKQLPANIRFEGGEDLDVLVVDDSAVNRDLLSRLLKDMGVQVELACSGTEALEMAQQRDYGLVLMDIRMPDMSGTEVERRLRRIDRYRAVPIVACTADTRTSLSPDPERTGFDTILQKPFSRSQLAEVILRYCHMSQAADEPEDSTEFVPAEEAEQALGESWLALDQDVSKRILDAAAEALSDGDTSGVETLADELRSMGGGVAVVAERLKRICEDLDLEVLERLGETGVLK